jgi:hypothetical protein
MGVHCPASTPEGVNVILLHPLGSVMVSVIISTFAVRVMDLPRSPFLSMRHERSKSTLCVKTDSCLTPAFHRALCPGKCLCRLRTIFGRLADAETSRGLVIRFSVSREGSTDPLVVSFLSRCPSEQMVSLRRQSLIPYRPQREEVESRK